MIATRTPSPRTLALAQACTAALALSGCNRKSEQTAIPAATGEPAPMIRSAPMATASAVNISTVTRGTRAGSAGWGCAADPAAFASHQAAEGYPRVRAQMTACR